MTPRTIDTLAQVKAVRERYVTIAGLISMELKGAHRSPDQLIPAAIARSTIKLREVGELITQTNILPTAPVLAALISEYAGLIVLAVERRLL